MVIHIEKTRLGRLGRYKPFIRMSSLLHDFLTARVRPPGARCTIHVFEVHLRGREGESVCGGEGWGWGCGVGRRRRGKEREGVSKALRAGVQTGRCFERCAQQRILLEWYARANASSAACSSGDSQQATALFPMRRMRSVIRVSGRADLEAVG